jgi:hypothetical protein
MPMPDADPRSWAISILVIRTDDRGSICERTTIHVPVVVLDRSRDEAIGKAHRIGHILYPVDDGFERHSVNAHDCAEVLDPDLPLYLKKNSFALEVP